MWPRVAAVSVVAVVLLSGCAGVRHRLLGGGMSGPPVEVPEDAKPLGHFLRGQVALTQNDVPTAVKEFEKAISEDPSTPWLRLRLAQLYIRQSRLDEALQQVKGVILSALGRDAEAVDSYERVLAIDPNVQEAYLYLGALYGKRGDLDKAVAILKKLIARNPTSILGYYYLGRVYAGSGHLDMAERYYLDALKLSPQSE